MNFAKRIIFIVNFNCVFTIVTVPTFTANQRPMFTATFPYFNWKPLFLFIYDRYQRNVRTHIDRTEIWKEYIMEQVLPPKWQYEGVGDTVLYGWRMMINMRPKSCHYLNVAKTVQICKSSTLRYRCCLILVKT